MGYTEYFTLGGTPQERLRDGLDDEFRGSEVLFVWVSTRATRDSYRAFVVISHHGDIWVHKCLCYLEGENCTGVKVAEVANHSRGEKIANYPEPVRTFLATC